MWEGENKLVSEGGKEDRLLINPEIKFKTNNDINNKIITNKQSLCDCVVNFKEDYLENLFNSGVIWFTLRRSC